MRDRTSGKGARRIVQVLDNIKEAIEKHTKAQRSYNESQKEKGNIPAEVRAEVRFDDQTVRDATIDKNADRRIQNSIKRAAWSAFFAASIYAGIATYQAYLMRAANSATQRQLDDVEASTSARLIIEDFKPTLKMGEPGQGMLIDGAFTITNVGGTVADDIYFTDTLWSNYRIPGPLGAATPPPDTGGLPGVLGMSSTSGSMHYPSLAPGKSLEYPVGTQVGQWAQVEVGKWFVGDFITVTYRTIFPNNPSITFQDCFMYDYRAKGFFRCPTGMAREDRLVPKK
jgi:hypothetical protein